MSIAILCSGQGHQAAGMFDLVADRPEAQAVFAAGAAALGGRDPRKVATSGEDLHVNATAQALCCTQALAVWAVLEPEVRGRVVVAGYSVGEVAAWGVAGALTPDAVFEVVARRAASMDAAHRSPSGLVAIGGLERPAVEALCRSEGTFVAIRVGPDRVIVGGRRDDLDRMAVAASSRGATSVRTLPVQVASHTPLLREAAEIFGAVLRDRRDVARPRARLLSGIDGAAVFDVRSGLAKLGRQVAETVDWAACLESCRAAGATRALELGPGDALARMMANVIDGRASRSFADFRSVDGVVDWLRSSTAQDGR